MAIRIALHHKTSYRYDRQVTLSPHEVRLRPAPHSRTRILSYSMRVEPARNSRGTQPQDGEEQAIAQLLSIDNEVLVCSFLPRTAGQY